MLGWLLGWLVRSRHVKLSVTRAHWRGVEGLRLSIEKVGPLVGRRQLPHGEEVVALATGDAVPAPAVSLQVA